MKKYIAIATGIVLLLTGCSVPPNSKPVEILPEPKTFEFPSVSAPQKITLQNLDPNYVRSVAGTLLWEEYKKMGVSESKLNHVVSPTFPKEIYEGTLEQWQIGANFFNDVAVLDNSYIFWVTPDDADWINKALCDEAKYCPGTGEYYYDIGKAMKEAEDGCGFNGGELRMGNSNLVTECIIPEEKRDYSHIGTHEYAHFVEMETFEDTRYTSWWTEGTATYFSFFFWAIKDESVETYKHGIAGMDFTLNDQNVYEVPINPTVADYEHMLDLVDDNPTQNAWSLGYYLGALCVEALVASFGVDVVKQHYALVPKLGWKNAFKKSFGVTTDEFRKLVAPYLKARHDLDKKL